MNCSGIQILPKNNLARLRKFRIYVCIADRLESKAVIACRIFRGLFSGRQIYV